MNGKRIRNWLTILVVATVVYTVGNLYQPTVVVGDSMAPTLRSGRVIWIDRTYYRSHAPRCGEVVVFRRGDTVYVKRVYRGPGERVCFITSDGEWMIPVRESRVQEVRRGYGRMTQAFRVREMRVPDDCVFVLGDNYLASVDSRQLGPIPIREIMGRAHLDVDTTRAAQQEHAPRPVRRQAQAVAGKAAPLRASTGARPEDTPSAKPVETSSRAAATAAPVESLL